MFVICFAGNDHAPLGLDEDDPVAFGPCDERLTGDSRYFAVYIRRPEDVE